MANILDIPTDSEVSELADLLTRCMEIGSKANQLLARRDRRICLELAFNVVTDVLAGLDRKAALKSPLRRTGNLGKHLNYLGAEVEKVEAFYRDAARQRARLSYFWGMVNSVLGLAVLLAPWLGRYSGLRQHPRGNWLRLWVRVAPEQLAPW